ncbi:MAG: hypothetical protein RSC06_15855 [Clostridia bacterium]
MDHYISLQPMDADYAWRNGAYTEDGNVAICDRCGEDMQWNPVMQNWHCQGCEQIMDRPVYFNHIGANPPGSYCIPDCEENYPYCKKRGEHYEIDPNDPLMDPDVP